MNAGYRPMLAVAALALIAGACSSSSNSGPSTGSFSVVLTDATNPLVGSATVYTHGIYLIGGSDSSGQHVTITTTPASYDLLSLQNGVTAALGTSTIPVGTYSQMRLIVDSARVTLASGYHFSDNTTTRLLTVPSGMQTGIKVVFDSVFVSPGQTILVVDFDVSRNFVFTGPPTAPIGVLFKPVLHATVQNVAASIAGTVTPASSHARVFAINGSDTVTTATADTLTGAYKLWFLPPATYTVTAAGTGLTASPKTITLRAGQDTTGVNFP